MRNALFLILTVIFIISCKKNTPKENVNVFNCSYKRLENSIAKDESESGNTIKLEAILKGNIQKLVEAEGSFSFSDSIIINRSKTESIKFVKYSIEFIEKHNAIVDILCSIEKEMLDSNLTAKDLQHLRSDLWTKRTSYFDYLISSEKKMEDEHEKNRQINVHNNEKPRGTKNYEISIYLNEGEFDLSTAKVNGKLVHLKINSTKQNIRFDIKEEKFSFQLNTIEGKTCKKNYSLDGKKKLYVLQFTKC